MSALYAHIPFCRKACHYCDFHFETTVSLRKTMVEALCKELEMRAESSETISSVYLGGGTPSLLNLQELQNLLNQVFRCFSIAPDAEITLEANPEDISLEYATGLRSLGINRLSIGIQSFVDSYLKMMNRTHSARQSLKAVEIAQSVGFDNLTIDLIYGLPGQSLSQWEEELKTAFSLGIQHLSAYSLTIEPGTAFGRWQKNGKLIPADDEHLVAAFQILANMAENEGFVHYEVSNLCKPGYYSRHNSNYWKRGNYIGIGPSAHSYNGRSRSWNIAHNRSYIARIQAGNLPCETEILTPQNHVNETLMTGLRTIWGCRWVDLSKWGYVAEQKVLEKLVNQGLAEVDSESIRLTRTGWLLADQIASDLFWVD